MLGRAARRRPDAGSHCTEEARCGVDGATEKQDVIIPPAVKSLSEQARSFLECLHQSWSGRSSTVGEMEKARLIQQIAECREAAAIPSLVVLLYAQSGRVSDLAAAAIDQIVASSGVMELAELDRAVREISEWRGPQIGAKNLRAVSRGFIGTLGVISFNASGYVREAAVRALAAFESSQALPFLLIRLNDWVPAVREQAKAAVLRYVRPSDATAIIRCLPLLLRLKQQRRGEHQEVVDALLGILLEAENREALLDGLRSSDNATRRSVFRMMADRQDDGLLAVLREGLRSDDTVVRLMAVRGLRGHLAGFELQEALEPLLCDRFMPLRREALYGFVEKLPEQAVKHLNDALFDRHAPIRDLARFYLRRVGEADFSSLYRTKLVGTGSGLSVAVAGLGETGTADDALLLLPFLKHSDPRVRWAAVRAIGRLDSERYDDEMLAALSDTSARVAKAAREIVVLRRYLLTSERLWPIFQKATVRHVRRVALSLMAELPWWESAPLLVSAAGSDDEDVHDRALTYLRRWEHNYHRLSRRPSANDLAALQAAVAANSLRLDQRTEADIRSLIDVAARESASASP